MARRRGNGEGSIYQRADGRWCAAISVGQRRRVLYGKTRREVAERLAALQQEATTGGLVDPSRLTVGEYLTTWLDAVRPQLRATSWASSS